MSTELKIKSVCKSHFNGVEPVPSFLGHDENVTERFAVNKPLRETLPARFKSRSVQEQRACTRSQPPAPANLLCHVKDSEGFKSNLLMKTDSDSVVLILYQHAFEVVKPLGSGKKKTFSCLLISD